MTTKTHIRREFDSFTRQYKYILRCAGVLNGTILGDHHIEAIYSLREIDRRHNVLGLDKLV